jgi:hypothetical protein
MDLIQVLYRASLTAKNAGVLCFFVVVRFRLERLIRMPCAFLQYARLSPIRAIRVPLSIRFVQDCIDFKNAVMFRRVLCHPR